MQFGELMDKEREFILRSLSFCGIRVIIPLSNGQGRFKLSEVDLQEQEIKEIHLLDTTFPGIIEALEHINFVLKARVGKWTIFVPKETMLHEGSFDGIFKVGHVVIMNTGFLGEPSGTKAFVYHTDSETCSIISDRGINIGKFTVKEQHEHLIFLKDSLINYKYIGDTELREDCIKGMFKTILE